MPSMAENAKAGKYKEPYFADPNWVRDMNMQMHSYDTGYLRESYHARYESATSAETLYGKCYCEFYTARGHKIFDCPEHGTVINA